MKIIELSRSYCRKEYGGNFQKMIEAEDGLLFDDETIRRAFSGGRGTEKDLERYIEANRPFVRFYDIEKHKYI